jgi:hypothetical protein
MLEGTPQFQHTGATLLNQVMFQHRDRDSYRKPGSTSFDAWLIMGCCNDHAAQTSVSCTALAESTRLRWTGVSADRNDVCDAMRYHAVRIQSLTWLVVLIFYCEAIGWCEVPCDKLSASRVAHEQRLPNVYAFYSALDCGKGLHYSFLRQRKRCALEKRREVNEKRALLSRSASEVECGVRKCPAIASSGRCKRTTTELLPCLQTFISIARNIENL